MTPLRFRIVAAPAGVAPPPLPGFTAAATIGRSEANTLVLHDPTGQMSRQHCRLEPTPAGWQLVDLSANGTFVNDMLVGRGNARPIGAGDMLRMADWVIAVEGPGGGAAAHASMAGAPDPLDPFGIGDISRAQPARPAAAPLPPQVAPQEPLFGAGPDPFGPGAAASPFGAPGMPHGLPAASPMHAPPPGGPVIDPFATPGHGFGAPGQAAPLPEIPPALAGSLDSLSVPLPTPMGAPQGGGLPDDWLDEALSGLAPKSQPAAPAPPPPPPASPVAAPLAAAAPPLPDDDLAAFAPPTPMAAPLAPPMAAPAPPPAPHPAPHAATPPAGGAEPGLAAFLHGAGIAAPQGLAAEAALAELGRANRLLARSLMRLLAARRAVKSEFRISQTVVGARENNPLKFSADEAEMVAILLGASRPGFQAGAAAVADATRDLEAHQLALLAAFRTVIGQVLARLDPQAISGGEEDAGFLGRLTGSGKTAAWDKFVQTHADLKQDFAESLRGRLAQVFAEAYEEESRRHGGS